MFFRQKRSGKYTYLQIVENRWEDGRSKQRVIVTLGRLDELREHGYRKYRKYLKGGKTHFEIDQQKIKSEARYDGKWVLRTNLDELSAEEVALRYKQLWMVEDCIRSIKSILETRPIFHHHDETLHVHFGLVHVRHARAHGHAPTCSLNCP